MSSNQSFFRSGPSWADRWNAIGGDDLSLPPLGRRSSNATPQSRRSTGSLPQGQPINQASRRLPGMPPGMPLNVQVVDLEEYMDPHDVADVLEAMSAGRFAPQSIGFGSPALGMRRFGSPGLRSSGNRPTSQASRRLDIPTSVHDSNGFGSSSSRPTSQANRRPGIPTSVHEDLEEYLNRLDTINFFQPFAEGRDAAEALPAEIPTVPRFCEEDFAKLRRVRHNERHTGATSSSDARGVTNVNWRAKLEELYEKCNPGKLHDLDAMLQKYKGREAWVYQQVCTKYGVQNDTIGGPPLSKAASTSDSVSSGAECHICLTELRTGEALLELPCSQKHRFHEECIKQWLSKSITCPLCRTDVKAVLPATDLRSSRARASVTGRRSTQRTQPPSHTAMGGVVLRYERDPPTSWERPSYIPSHLRHLAQYLEVEYPGQGVAKIWRVPNSATADLSHALPEEA